MLKTKYQIVTSTGQQNRQVVMEEIKLRDFEITYAIEKDLQVEQFAVGNELTDLLNKELQLKSYCDTITSLFVVFQCFDPENDYIKPKAYQKLRRKTKVIELYLLLDYNKIKQADKATTLQILAENYISGVSEVLKRKDFNIIEFTDVVKRIFKPYIPEKQKEE